MADGLGAHPPAISGLPRRLVTIAANFTADPLIAPLQFWWPRLFADDARIECTGYNQIFQNLIAPGSVLASKEPGANVLLVRVEDWAEPRRISEEFVTALTAFAARAGRATFLVICPASARVAQKAAIAECAD